VTEPYVLVDPPLTPDLRTRLVDMWVRVTNAGGSVGFVPPVIHADIWPTAVRSFARVESGEDTLVCLAVPADAEPQADARTATRAPAAPAKDRAGAAVQDRAEAAAPADVRAGSERAEDGAGAEPATGGPRPTDPPRIIAWLLLAESESHLRRHWRTVYRVQVDPDWHGGGLGRRLMSEAAIVARDKLGLEALTLMTRGGTGAERFYERCGYREVGRIPGAIRVGPGDDRDEVHFWLDLAPDPRPAAPQNATL
jgi:GNAT superfamily N-acetyltransferase